MHHSKCAVSPRWSISPRHWLKTLVCLCVLCFAGIVGCNDQSAPTEAPRELKPDPNDTTFIPDASPLQIG